MLRALHSNASTAVHVGNRIICHTLLAFLCSVGWTGPAFAQQTTSEVYSAYQNRMDVSDTLTMKLLQQRQAIRAGYDAQALESAIDPSTYILGPGDGVYLDVYAMHALDQDLTVTPEGRLLIPRIGQVDVAGLTLTEAQKRVIAVLSKDYKSPDASLSLRKLRAIKVNVIGDVLVPGVQTVTAMQRVSEVIDRSGGLKANSSLREIEVRSATGKLRAKADLYRYYSTGDLSSNPMVEGGDVVVVPTASRFVVVSGGVVTPARMEFVEGDDLASAIALARGLLPAALTDTVEIARFDDANPSHQNRMYVNYAKGENPKLHDGDMIFIRTSTKYHVPKLVGIGGEVRYPGRYAIEPGSTRLRDLIVRAGGTLSTASLDQATLIRRVGNATWENDPEYKRLYTLAPLRKEGLTDEETDYYLARSNQFSRSIMVVDFKRLMNGDETQNILLREEDSIAIPREMGYVTVSGSVNAQGNIGYIEGGSYEEYIAKAGGYNSNADRGNVRVVNPQTGSYIDPNSDRGYKIAPGDLIIVPHEKNEFWKNVGTVTALTAQVLTIVAGIYFFFKKP